MMINLAPIIIDWFRSGHLCEKLRLMGCVET